MKQLYKDLLINYLSDKDGYTVTSKPAGWSGNKVEINNKSFHTNDRVYGFIKLGGNEIEHGLIWRLIHDNVGYDCASYNLKYDAATQSFVGTKKGRLTSSHVIQTWLDVPDDVLFDTASVSVNIKSKKTVDCGITLNIKNGILPENKQDLEKRFERIIESQIYPKLKEIGGRVTGSLFRTSFKYDKRMLITFNVRRLSHGKNELIVKL